MHFEWNENENKINRCKHGVSVEPSRLVFDDPCAISTQDRYENGEARWQTLGLVGGTVILLVAHAYGSQGDDEVIRIISARKATRKERLRYEQAE